MNPAVSELLARWKEEPRPAVAISLCHALAEAGGPRAPSADGRRRPRPPLPAGYHDVVLEVGGEAASRYHDDAEVLLAISRMYLATGKLVAEAQTVTVQAARLVPNDPRAFRLLGETLLRRGDAVRAVKAFARAIAGGMSDPSTRAWSKRAHAYQEVQEAQGQAVIAAELLLDLGETPEWEAGLTSPVDLDATTVGEIAAAPRDASAPDEATVEPGDEPSTTEVAAVSAGTEAPSPASAATAPGAVVPPRMPGRPARRPRTATLMGMPSSPQKLGPYQRVAVPGAPAPAAATGAAAEPVERMQVGELVPNEDEEKTRVAPPKPPSFERAPGVAAGSEGSDEDAAPEGLPRLHSIPDDDQATQITSMDHILAALEEMPKAPAYRGRAKRDSDATVLRTHELLYSPTGEGGEDGRSSQPNIWVPIPAPEPEPEPPTEEREPAGALPDVAISEPSIDNRAQNIVDEPSWDATTRVLDRPPLPPSFERAAPDPDLARTAESAVPSPIRPAPALPRPTLPIRPGDGTPSSPGARMPTPGATAEVPAGGVPITATMPAQPYMTPAERVPYVPVVPPGSPVTVPMPAVPPLPQVSTATMPAVPPSSVPPLPSRPLPPPLPPPSSRSPPTPGSGPPPLHQLRHTVRMPGAASSHPPPRDVAISLTDEAELVEEDTHHLGPPPRPVPPGRVRELPSGDVHLDAEPPQAAGPSEDSDVVTIANLRTRSTRPELAVPSPRAARLDRDEAREAAGEESAPLNVAPGPPMKVTELYDEFEGDGRERDDIDEVPARRDPGSLRGSSLHPHDPIQPLPGPLPEEEPRPMSGRPPPMVASSPPPRRASWVGKAVLLLALLGGGGAAGAYFHYELRHPVDPARGEAMANAADEALRAGDPRSLASADKVLRDAHEMAPGSRVVAVAEARTRALRALDDAPSAQAPLRDAIAVARSAGADTELAGPELVLAAVAGDTAGAAEAIKRHDATHGDDPLYQLAAGAVLERRGEAAVDRYQAAAKSGWRSATIRLARSLLVGQGPRDAKRARELAATLDPASGSVIVALADLLDGKKPTTVVPPAEVADLSLPLRSLAWALSALSRSEARGASTGLAAAIDDADAPAVAVLCGRVALAVGDVDAATQALGRANKLAPETPAAVDLQRELALLGGDLGKAVAAPGTARAIALLEQLSKQEDNAAVSAAVAEVFPMLREPASPLPPLAQSARAALEAARATRPLDTPWIDLLLVDAALDHGDLDAARSILDRYTDPGRQRLFGARRARLLRYQGKAAEARAAMGEVKGSRRAWLEQLILDGAEPAQRERALAALGEPKENDERWAVAYLRAKAGDEPGARKALLRARLPNAPLTLRMTAALALAEMRDARAKGFVQALLRELPKNPDAQQAATQLGVALK